MKHLNAIDLAKNELQNARIHVLAAAPSSPVEGQVYYDSTLHQFGYYNNTTWIYPASGGVTSVTAGDTTITIGGSGTAPTVKVAKTLDHTWITDFDTQVRTSRLDQMAAPTASVSLNSQKITNLLDPTAAQDAASKNYVDGIAQGITQKHEAVVVSTANQASLTGLPTVDGITLTDAQTILLTAQSTASQNGLWAVHSGAWTRPTFFAVGADAAGSYVYIQQGTTFAASGWTISGAGPITIDTTAQTWTQFTGAGEIIAGTGITKTGNTIALTTPVTVVLGGTGATTAGGARTNLGATGKYSSTIGDGSTLAYTINHALGTTDVHVSVWEATGSLRLVVVDCAIVDANNLTVTFAVAPATNSYRVVVVG